MKQIVKYKSDSNLLKRVTTQRKDKTTTKYGFKRGKVKIESRDLRADYSDNEDNSEMIGDICMTNHTNYH